MVHVHCFIQELVLLAHCGCFLKVFHYGSCFQQLISGFILQERHERKSCKVVIKALDAMTNERHQIQILTSPLGTFILT